MPRPLPFRIALLALCLLPALRAARGAEPSDPAALVPADAAVYVEAAGVRRFVTECGASALAEPLQRSELATSAARAAWSICRTFAYVYLGRPLPELYERYIDHLAVFAFRGPDGPGPARPEWTLLVHLGDRTAEFRELLGSARPRFESIDRRSTFQRLTYGDTAVETLATPDGKGFSHALVGDWWVVGPFDRVRDVCDVRAGKRCALSADPSFVSAAALRPQSGVFIFSDVEAPLMADRLSVAKDATGQIIAGLAPVRAVAAAVRSSGDQYRSTVLLETGGRASGLGRLLRLKPGASPRAFDVIPDSAEAALVGDFGSSRAVLDEMRALVLELQGPAGLRKVAEANQNSELWTGVRTRTEFYDPLEGEFFIAMRVPRFSNLGPMTGRTWADEARPILGLRLTDADRYRLSIDRLRQSPVLQGLKPGWEQRRHEGSDYWVVTFPAAPLPVVYTFVDDFILVALDEGVVRDTLTRIARGQVLSKQPESKRMLAAMDPGATLRVVARPEVLWNELIARYEKSPRSFPGAAVVLPELRPVVARYHGFWLSLRPVEAGLLAESESLMAETFVTSALAGAVPFGPRKPAVAPETAAVCARLAAARKALERYRARQGAYPETLDALVPFYLAEVPSDPYAPDRPIGYLVSPARDRFCLSSVGPDGAASLKLAPERLGAFLLAAESLVPPPEAVEELKQSLYRFRFWMDPDEQAVNDEGDIVLWNTAREAGK